MSMFVAARRDIRAAKSTAAAYRNEIGVGPDCRLNVGIDVADKAAVVHILAK